MQTSGKKACFQFSECSLSYAKIMHILAFLCAIVYFLCCFLNFLISSL